MSTITSFGSESLTGIVHVLSEEQHAVFLTKALDTEPFRFRSNFVMNLWYSHALFLCRLGDFGDIYE